MKKTTKTEKEEEAGEGTGRFVMLKVGIVLFACWMIINLIATLAMFYLGSTQVYDREFWEFYVDTIIFELFFIGMSLAVLVAVFWFVKSIKKGNDVRKS